MYYNILPALNNSVENLYYLVSMLTFDYVRSVDMLYNMLKFLCQSLVPIPGNQGYCKLSG